MGILAVSEDEKRIPNVLRPDDYYLQIQPYYPAPGVDIPEGSTFIFQFSEIFIQKKICNAKMFHP
jgi:hypothetical protein